MGLMGAASTLALGTQAGRIPGVGDARAGAAETAVRLTVTDALVEMVDLRSVYMWSFAGDDGPRVPGPVIEVTEGDEVHLEVTNALDEAHAFAVVGTGVTTPPIPPGQTVELRFAAPPPGTYIYIDPLAAPVNRLMGLHGVLVVMARSGEIPYADPPPALSALFGDLGRAGHFPGDPWRAERTRIWHLHTVDPRWHARAEAGQVIDPALMAADYLPRYFLVNGKSGWFSSHDAGIAPAGRIGEPHLIRIVNTGMTANSLHIHGNHVYLLAHNGALSRSVPYIDSWRVGPLDRADWLLPFVAPPDIPGTPGAPLADRLREELAYRDAYGVRQSPLEYPMHCHMEHSQTAAGGNYPGGMVAHWSITGDLDGPDFPDEH